MHMHTHTHIHKLKHSRQWARAGECREVAGRDRRQGKAGQGREGRAEGKGGGGGGGQGRGRQGEGLPAGTLASKLTQAPLCTSI